MQRRLPGYLDRTNARTAALHAKDCHTFTLAGTQTKYSHTDEMSPIMCKGNYLSYKERRD